MTSFKAPGKSLGPLGAEVAASVIAAASDFALVIDSGGVIRDLALTNEDLSRELAGGEGWVGRKWLETVAEDSRGKVEALMREVESRAAPRWRHINQGTPPGGSVPILCTAVRLGEAGRAVIFGRDLRPISDLQQRLVEAQQSVERDYTKLRQAETRYRLLFQISPEPVLILDAAAGRVLEMNPAAARLFGTTAKRLAGRPLTEALAPDSQEVLRLLLAGVRISGRSDEATVTLVEEGQEIGVTISPLRQEDSLTFLVRLAPARGELAPVPAKSKLLQAVEGAPDAFVVTDHEGRILDANAAFIDAAQLANEEQAVGQSLGRWLGRQGVELDVLLGALRQRGSVRLFATALQGELGTSTEVEVSAVSVREPGGRPCYGFAIRDVGLRLATGPGRSEPLRSVNQLTELIGRVPLKDLVREATDVIERLCIEAALQLTGDNRASAAEMLGLSRQSLYVKLRRYGLGDLGPENGDPEGALPQ
ncbi:transcriptional regulator PpsR [Belnapia sp. T6]|uniref:Transcriptional regulator PpsR n=1 Tax=Belnapia mucosa TaxID=2804532 RepID=A0ABS1V1R6_9PROT|nr:transcriptional regulator PpsR [Belnapia mucosa]MBL6455642.1 transcriptional regulator PpsR [Belnapia mucosa]